MTLKVSNASLMEPAERCSLVGQELHDLVRTYLSWGRTVVKNQELVISKLARRLTGHSKEINCSLDISKKLTARFVPQFLHPGQVAANCSFS